jgi:2-polyprenyl-6-methoxyphenol hydroxylase-like FAD-dependent oxidoreductase
VTSPPIDVPIVIVGGGPVGLALAADLGWRDVPCLLIEKTDGEVRLPKTNGVNIRTMEFCRRWGLTDEIRSSGLPKDWPRDQIFITSMNGWELCRVAIPSLEDAKPVCGAIETYVRIPQTEFDPIVRRYAASRPSVTLRYRASLEDFAQEADGVRLLVRDLDGGATHTIRCSYLVGCDGANSAIRSALGFSLQGRTISYSTNLTFRCPDFVSLHDKGKGRSYNAVGPDGRWAELVAINGKELWGFHIRGPAQAQMLTEAEVRMLLHNFMGFELEYQSVACVNWLRKEMIADHYSSGRVFLAGDAVHLLSPSGTLGMNTGNGDATNLSWKLEAALKGWAGPHLLDSYEAERRPIGVNNIAAATELYFKGEPDRPGPAILEDSPEGARVRARVGRELAARDVYPPTEGLQIGLRYDDSSICASETQPPPALSRTTYSPSTYPGSRAPDGWLGGAPLLDRFGRGFTLVRATGAPSGEELSEAAQSRGIALSSVTIDDPALTSLYERPLVLVRPDGHVAWRGAEVPDDPGSLIDTVRGAAASTVA